MMHDDVRPDSVLNEAGEVVKAGCVVRNTTGQYLMVYEGGPWGFPKGHTELGESIQESAVRETEEETGYAVEVLRRLPDLTYSYPSGQAVRLHLWLARALHEDAHPTDTDERYAWMDEAELKRQTFPSNAAYLERYADQLVID